MTALAWDEVGERTFETGVDRGVLYLASDQAVAWNGLTSVEEQSSRESQSFYLDGVKFLERVSPGDFSGVIRAYTYPVEFEVVQGVQEIYDGLSIYDQPSRSFSLSYRTKIGNDVDGEDHGYKLHILYNLIAIPDSVGYSSINESVTPIEFSWTLKGTPVSLTGFRPTVHISIDSRADPDRYAAVERLLYGTEDDDPVLPALDDFVAIFETYNDLYIVDNGDGTWTATDPGENFITMLDSTTFSIDDADVTIIDVNTYTISDTDLDV